ncbi:G8 domain-containing protein [Bradyrhizobium sp. BRP56]|uniref:G8 domain-containing protein n=1 Tax=Bradyrhizobium sp. BRP56 TaxID=2793819 RepID=UPI001CD3F20D|nr:G8 domain-containing protein [Bradyrhizobium sp. BRP56]MCA1397019.1 G8 domain-containing protein [Bradyrhizobium sp. BRP56]
MRIRDDGISRELVVIGLTRNGHLLGKTMRTGFSIALLLVVALSGVLWAANMSIPDGHQLGHLALLNGGCDTRASGHAADHVPDLARHREHSAALDLVALCSETDIAASSGDWSAPSTWVQGKPPADGAKVRIPSGLTVKIDKEFTAKIDWIRVDGALVWSTDQATSVKVGTIVVTPDGALEMGTVDHPVSKTVVAKLTFAARTFRDREHDPFDMAGGLISMGAIRIHGAEKTAWKIPQSQLVAGVAVFQFDRPASNWSAGDELIVPGTSDLNSEDETPIIVSVEGERIVLDRPLKYSHLTPDGTSVPIGNLTRNVRVSSEAAASFSARGHIMFLHQQTGVNIDGAEFRDLGRTDTKRAQTAPDLDETGKLVPGSDDNTIGRYALHFHVVSGARIDIPPHVVRNSVARGSPKHGIVNHGGHLLAENNVTFAIAGSHFLAENGTEIGSFRGNLAIRSTGSGEDIVSRMGIFDNGHQGHGFWMQSAGVRVTDNWAFGHAAGAYVVFGYSFAEGGNRTYFNARNTDNRVNADVDGRISTSDVDLYFARNHAAGSTDGVEIWNHKLLAPHPSQSLIEDITVWNVSRHALFIPYVRDTLIRNVYAYGGERHMDTDFAIGGNSQTENITFQNVTAERFPTGLVLPRRGINAVDGAFLRNRTNIMIESANRPFRVVTLRNIHVPSEGATTNFDLKDMAVPANGDVAMLFENDRIFWNDSAGKTFRLYFGSQNENFVPFANSGPTDLKGLTSGEIKARFGVAFGGQLAPADAKPLPRSNATMALVDADNLTPTSKEMEFAQNPSNELYPLAGQHIVNTEDQVAKSRWMFAPGSEQPNFVFVKKTSPKLIVHPLLRKLEIHPDDVRYGYRLEGIVADMVGNRITTMAFIQDFPVLRPDGQGHIALDVKFPDPAGDMTSLPLSLTVTKQAVRRGRNYEFYKQAQYCGKCNFEQEMERDIRATFAQATSGE